MSTDESTASARARSFWSGTISFGLVSIPVELYPASRPSRVSLRMLDRDGTPLRRRFFDVKDRMVESDALVRGYEIEKDEFVVVTDEELESLEPRKSRDIDLRLFVDADEIEPLYFERAYFLTPSGNSNKAYRLLAEVMERTGKAGIASFVMRTREYLVAILAENGILRAETLRFHDEVRSAADIGLPEPVDVPATEVKRMARAIAARTETDLETSELKDTYAERLRDLVARKRDAGEDVVDAPARDQVDDDEDDDIIDLMQILKRSMQAADDDGDGKGSSGSAARRTAARKSGGSRKAARKTGRAVQSGGARSARTSLRTAARSTRAKAGKADDLAGLTKAELYERAQSLAIPGRSGMDRDALERAVRQAS